MKVTILNGNPNSENVRFDQYLRELVGLLESAEHGVTLLQIRDLDVKYCIGCFDCWVRTPGECKVTDSSHDICREYINSDFVLFASPVIMGFTSALLKKANDKLLPLLLPYLVVVQNECHHPARYDKYPATGLLLDSGDDCDEEDVRIISDIYARNAINLKTALRFTKLTTDPIEEVADAIGSV
jgi:multimeric flavodoxin WrbA